MPPRNRPKPDQLSQVHAEVNHRLEGSLLAPIAVELAAAIDQCPREHLQDLAASIQSILHELPTRDELLDNRFLFDSSLIATIAESWNASEPRMSAMIVPAYWGQWAYDLIHFPAGQAIRIPRVDIISFPGGACENEIDLLDYPWLCHELGHCILRRDESSFANPFRAEVEKELQSLRLRSIADTGANRDRGRKILERLQELWSPTSNQRNWAHEIAVDVIALWTCGPAFLATFEDILHDESLNPYQIDQGHPPYELRSAAMVVAGQSLGWKDSIEGIENRMNDWQRGARAPERNSHYLALTNRNLLSAVVRQSLAACEQMKLPLCSAEQLTALRQRDVCGDEENFGVEVILDAWRVESERGREQFLAWQARILTKHIVDLKQ